MGFTKRYIVQKPTLGAVDSNPENGCNYSINGEKVTIEWFCDMMTSFWQELEAEYGVRYHGNNTASCLDELEPWIEEVVEEIVPAEEPSPDRLATEDNYSQTFRTDTEIIYTTEVEVRDENLGA